MRDTIYYRYVGSVERSRDMYAILRAEIEAGHVLIIRHDNMDGLRNWKPLSNAEYLYYIIGRKATVFYYDGATWLREEVVCL